MTIGSAASLPSHGSEAQFPYFRSLHRNGRLPLVSNIQTAGAPQRHIPKIGLADDPPRGRILIVADQVPLALDVQRVLRNAGYRAVGPAESAEDADRLIGQRPIDGAVVDLQLKAGNAAAVADRLAHQGIPFVWLTSESTDRALDAVPQRHDRAPMVSKPVKGEDLVQALERALSSGQRSGKHMFYPVPPPQEIWPRVFPPL